ncbi:MAG: hypothetical protein ABII06_05065 [Pseudomonadota bacterium]
MHQKTIAEENYFKDPEWWKKWETLIAKNPDDQDLQTIHALRVGLCMKVSQ